MRNQIAAHAQKGVKRPNPVSLAAISRGVSGGGEVCRKVPSMGRYVFSLKLHNHNYLPQKVTIAPVDKTIKDMTTLAIFTKTSLES